MAANRYIERYKKGLQQREEKRQSKMAWSKTNKFLTGAAAITAGAFAAHTLHPKGIIGALESVAKPTNAAFGAFKSTMDRYVSGSGHGVLKGVDTAINAVDVFNNPKGAVDHFRSTYKSIAKRTDDLHIDILRKQKTNVIDGIKKALKRDAISTQANKNLNKFIEDNEGDLAKIASDFQKKNQYRLSKLSSGDKKEVNYALAKLDSFNEANKEIRDSAQKMIFDSISGASEARPKNVENIQADALKKMMDEIVENQQSQSSFIKKKFNNIFGYKNATVDDLLNYGDDFLDDESRKFLNTLKINHGADFKKFVVDDSLYMYNGKVVDSRNFKKLGRNIRSGFSGGILGHLTYQRDLMAMNDFSKRAGTLIRSGYNVPTLDGYGVLGKDGVLKESLISVGDNIYRLNDMSKPLAEGFHLASGRYGSTKRLVSSMSGVNAPDWSNERAYNWLLDVGGKRQPGLLTKFKSIFTKSKDPLYFKNEMNRLFTVTEDMAQKIQSGTASSVLPEIDYRMMKDLEQYMRHQSSGFGHEMLDKVLRDLEGTEISSKLKGLKFNTEDDLVESYIKVTKEHLGKQGAKMPDDTSLRARAYNILNTSTQRKNKRIFAGNKLNEGKDRLLRDISEKVTNLRGSDRTLEIAESMYKNKEISGAQFVEINKSVASFKISGSMDGSSFDGAEITKILAGKKDPYVRLAIEDSIKETHPAFGFGRVKEFQENFHGDVLPVKKFNPKILNDWKSVITGGRNDMSKVNKGTLLTYGMMHRLNDMVRHFDFMPLAMSDDSMGSPLSTFGNIMAKRVMPIYAGVTALKYTSDYWSEISGSGYTLEQHKERAKANATLRLSKFKDATGLTSAFKFFDRVTPGNEGIKASVNKLPFMGPLAPLTIGMEALNSVGTFSGRTEKEWVDYFNTGEDPVRKGRYWILGSTPWMGESIDHYEPNSYRQAMSQWEYTDTVYGSRENYWAHSWMPTPTEPLAPVKRFVTDRYWFEKMHLKDRPYPLTGEMFDPNTPWGTLLNPTIGRILKPQFKLSAGATDEDLERIEKNNAYAKDVIARFSGGDLQLSTYIPKYTMSTNVGVATGGGRIGSGNVMVNGVAGNKANSNAVGVQGGGPGGSGAAIRLTENPESSGLVVNGQNYSLKDLKNINQSIIDKSGKISRINKKSILNTGFTMSYYEPREEGELALDVQSPTDIGYSMERTLDIFKDITGARGFLASMVTGGDDYGEGQAVLATASDAYAASSRFWDTGLGGRGGELSEIFRRFINKRPGLYKVINDIPNTMPGWMPDRFRTGDPYCVSPDTLIEINKGELKRADEVNIGDIIRTHKGAEIPVKDLAYRQIEKDEDVFEVTVATLPAFPFKVSEEHPILKVKDKKLIRNNVSVNDYQSANKILDLLNENSNLLQKEISTILDKSNASISRIFKLLKNSGKIEKVKNKTIVKSKEHFDIQDLIKKSYDKKVDLENIEWEKIKNINVGDYVAYPLPKTEEKDFVLDLKDFLKNDRYVFTENYCYYTVDKKYAQMFEFHKKNPDRDFGWGERKELLERRNWNDQRYEHAQSAVKRGAEPKRLKRFIKVDKNFMLLAGYYNAEGHTKDGRIEFSFHADEKKYHSEVISSFRQVFGKDINSYSHKEKDNGHTLSVGLMPAADLFENLFGKSAKEKHVPEFFFNLKDELVIAYLRSLINGDGSWFESFNRNRVTLKTISKKLAYQTRLLALKLKVVGAISKQNKRKSKIKSGPKKGQTLNLQTSYSLNFNGPVAVRIARLCRFDGIEGSENIKGTQWNIDNEYLYLRVNQKDKVKNIPTVIGFEVGIDNSFCVLGVATHNTEVSRGEIRLPGEAYESMNKLHPDEYGRYGAVDRAAILADIAPYSQEYKLWSKIASEQNLSQEAKEFLAQAKEQKEEANKKYHITPYKFLGQDIERESAVVEKFLDSSRFTVKGSDRIYRLAGVNTNFNAETEEGKNTLNILEQTMMPGSEITLLASKDSNPNASTPAVVYSQDSNVNRRLLDSGVQAKEEDGAIDTYVNLGVGGRALGRIWEGVAHAPIPIVHNKFFNVRSPMEHYKDYQVYGKEWQSWNEPVDDLLVPSFQSAWARNPFWATLSGATAGAITGLLLGGPGVRKVMSGFGAVAAGVGSIARSQYELETGKAWIPERREEERKIWEYYDLLKFVKNKRLYNKYVDVAKKEENVDVEKIISEMEEIDERLKKKEEMLEGFSKHLLRYGISKEDTVQKRINSEGRVEYNLVTEKEFIESKRKEILQELRDTKAEEVLVGLGPYARMAVKYRQEYRSTLFGLDGSSTFQQMFSAFPSKDREYLQHFSKVTDEKEREEILKIVPDNQKRAYKILWGMETEKESLIDMFGEYALPDENWFGWREGADLEDSMIKLIENNGYDPKDFGLWKDYTVEEELTPAPVEYGRRFDRKSSGFIRTRLEEVLTDYDIRDVDIKITPREDNSININFDMVQDVTGKIQLEIQRALGG